jgi:hypothetical protein
MLLGALQCGLGPVSIRIECVQPVLKHLIKVRQPVWLDSNANVAIWLVNGLSISHAGASANVGKFLQVPRGDRRRLVPNYRLQLMIVTQ